MDEYRNQNSDEPNSRGQAQPSESSYNSEAPGTNQQEQQAHGQPQSGQAYGQGQSGQPGQNEPQSGQPYWSNEPQNGQPYWPATPQNNQAQWQGGPQNSQHWQNGSPGSQPYWQNEPQNNQSYWQSGSPNNQQYWQNDSQNGQQYWQNGSSGGQQYWQNGQAPRKRNNLALASMIVGIFALITCCIPFIQFPLAVTAIVLVILSKKKQPFSGFAIAGLILGILAILSSIVMLLYWGAYLQLMNDPEFSRLINEMMQMYQ